MEENKFERQVQQKMDELKIHPSDAVWEKISLRIEKKKRPNRGILFFASVVLFFGLLTGGYILWNNPQHPVKEVANSEKVNLEKTTNKISAKEDKNPQPENNVVAGSVNSEKEATKNPDGKSPAGNSDINAARYKNINENSSQNHGALAKRIITIKSSGKATIAVSKPAVNSAVPGNIEVMPGATEKPGSQMENEKNVATIKDPGNQMENEKTTATIKDPGNDKSSIDSSSGPSSVLKEKTGITDTLRPIASHILKHSTKNKWRVGAQFTGGISGVGNNFLGFSNSVPLDYLSAVGGTPGNSQGPGVTTPSKTKFAFGFTAGVFAEKNVSKKIILSAGINFKSFNTSTKVGTRNDSTRFYSARDMSGGYNRYSNSYSFIELPVTLKIQIGKSKKLPWFWQGGLVVSELISSNALQFSQNSGLYYNDNSIFNKTQVGINTAFSASLFLKQKYQVLIGPYFYYSASSLANEGLYNKKHFVFTGLRTEIIFGKR